MVEWRLRCTALLAFILGGEAATAACTEAGPEASPIARRGAERLQWRWDGHRLACTHQQHPPTACTSPASQLPAHLVAVAIDVLTPSPSPVVNSNPQSAPAPLSVPANVPSQHEAGLSKTLRTASSLCLCLGLFVWCGVVWCGEVRSSEARHRRVQNLLPPLPTVLPERSALAVFLAAFFSSLSHRW